MPKKPLNTKSDATSQIQIQIPVPIDAIEKPTKSHKVKKITVKVNAAVATDAELPDGANNIVVPVQELAEVKVVIKKKRSVVLPVSVAESTPTPTPTPSALAVPIALVIKQKDNLKAAVIKVKAVATTDAKTTTIEKPKKQVNLTTTPVHVPTPILMSVPVPLTKPRSNSRLNSLTVPSIAAGEASKGAKSSYAPPLPPLPAPISPPLVVQHDPKLANNWKKRTAQELTDGELLAMPESEYMGKQQLDFFAIKLQTLKTTILESAGHTAEHLREDAAIVPDPTDRATIEEEHAFELRTRDRERKLLKKIDQALVLIKDGDYGYCKETGEPIGVARLLARPTATLCLEAQQRRELKQRMFGD